MNNSNYQESNVITGITESEDWYNISQGVLCCGLKKSYGVIPKVGDELTIHTKGSAFGIIRGMDLNGVKLFWKTDEELEENRKEQLHKIELDKQKSFSENVCKMDTKYNALPKCFRDRIDKFRANNDKFRIDFESYELFCCEQAVLIADSCNTPENVQKFAKKDWGQQMRQVPKLSKDHSGNTFSASCCLAYWYLSNPNNVQNIIGALTPLVGSVEYGDMPSTS